MTQIFNDKVTRRVVAVVWLVTIAETAIYFHPDCYIYYTPDWCV